MKRLTLHGIASIAQLYLPWHGFLVMAGLSSLGCHHWLVIIGLS
jgi:hypothetical protein